MPERSSRSVKAWNNNWRRGGRMPCSPIRRGRGDRRGRNARMASGQLLVVGCFDERVHQVGVELNDSEGRSQPRRKQRPAALWCRRGPDGTTARTGRAVGALRSP